MKKNQLEKIKTTSFTEGEQEIVLQVLKSARQEAEVLFRSAPKATQFIRTLKRLEEKIV